MFSSFPKIFLSSALIAVGLFHEAWACAAAVVLCIAFLAETFGKKRIVIRVNLSSVSVAVMTVFYLLSILWAVDRGMAFLGFLKFLPVPLFLLILMQRGEKPKEILSVLPAVTVFMTIFSAVVMIFSPRNEYFAPAGRLSGFLQYSNTYALLALLSLIIVVTRDKLGKRDWIEIFVLILGILLSGSRTVLLLLAFTVLILLFFEKNKKIRLIFLLITAGTVGAAAIYAAVSGNFSTIGRFLTTSFSESTFVGRLLYWQDALPLLLRYPFGTGYLGFYYLQSSVQTGLYSVRFVHNDFLQIALDIGVVPALLILVSLARTFFEKGAGLKKRLLLFVLAAHSFFDFDLQFTAIFIIFVCLLNPDDGKEFITNGMFFRLGQIGTAAVGISGFYLCLPLFCALVNQVSAAEMFYPWNTDVNIAMLTGETDPETLEKRADRIIAQNSNVTVAYSAKAAVAYTKGDFTSLIRYKDLAIESAPFAYDEYESYLYMLLVGEQLYREAGDEKSADFCVAKLEAVLAEFERIDERLSPLGKRIDDQPQTVLSDEIKTALLELADTR